MPEGKKIDLHGHVAFCSSAAGAGISLSGSWWVPRRHPALPEFVKYGVDENHAYNVEGCQVMPAKKEKNTELGSRLATFRKKQALSGGYLAELVGRTRQTWSGYESGAVEPALAVLGVLAKKCRLNVNWLLTGEGEMLSQSGEAAASPDEKDRRIAELETELKEERSLNRRLTARLLDEGGSEQ